MPRWASVEGAPTPLGTSWIAEEGAFNFALYCKHAWGVTLEFYADGEWFQPTFSFEFDPLRNKSGRIWHCRIPRSALGGARFYAYRLDGPPPEGRFEYHTFDFQKRLLDPWSRAVFFPPDFQRSAAMGPGSNQGRAPLSLLCDALVPTADAADRRRPLRHEADAVVYELHVKGFTAHSNSGVKQEERGTYAGLVEKIPYLVDLGVTVVELMPVFQFDPQEGNYWGYMPIHFFAPHHAFARSAGACGQREEFRAMVDALHEADIEVVLDVVYNHTGEGDEHGPTYAFKGIDNSTYYLLSGDPDHPYADYAGTGNTLHTANRYVRRTILGSLRYWRREMGVDGFRFDLASVFSRRDDGSIDAGDPPIFGEISSDPDLASARLIAEPWDAAGAYQLGRSFPGVRWQQWNGAFRDDVRRFVKSDPGIVPALMVRLYGSDDLFPGDRMNAYHPYQSVNHVTSHDGFTLYDLVSYNQRHNEANGHGNTDGSADNHSWNCGWEGDEGVPSEVMALRKRQIKNFCALLLLANGTPMFRAGDEFMQTQGGNNNPYNQDNETSWLDWSRLAANPDVFRFFKQMIAFRKQHPSLARSRFWREDVTWHGVGPAPDLSFESRSLAFHLSGASVGDADLYVMINAWWEPLEFAIQQGRASEWRRVVDTAAEPPDDFREASARVPVDGLRYAVGPRSLVVLLRG
jgi:isoamylase